MLNERFELDYDDYDEPAAMESEQYEDGVVRVVEINDNAKEQKVELDNCWNRFLKHFRGCWATKHTEDTVANRELYIKTTLRELLVYIIFLIVLMIIAFGMTSGLMYYYTNILTNLFTTSNFADNSGQYTTIASINDYWKFLTGPLLSGLYWNQWYNNNPVDASEINYIYYENKLIGIPRLRQVRVSSNSCDVPNAFQKDIVECFAPYSSKAESKESYGPGNSTAWNYTTENALDGRTSQGTIGDYDGGGYYVDLNLTLPDSLNTITFLFNNLWIDRGTRATIVDFTVYNANINLFCVIKLVTEFPATGGAISNYEFRTVKLIRYVTPSDYMIMACEVIFIFFIIYYVIEEVIEIRKHKWSYFLSIWNCMDIIVLFISILCAIFNVYRTFSVQNFLQKLLKNEDAYPNFDFLSYWQLQFNYAIAITLFFAWVKVFKYISFNKTMTQLSSTLGSCAKDLAGFAVMFFIIFLAFAQLGYLIFGSQCVDFRAFNISIYTLFRIILGDFDFNQLQTAQRVLGPLYFILYVFFVFFVLFNMFLAIINDTYTEVKADLANQANEFEMGDFFKQRANLMLSKLNLKRDKILDIQTAINSADKNDDNKLDFEEWRTELKARGYADGEIEAVFARYDTDGDRVLDESERRNMQMELEGQKEAINKEISRNVNESEGETDINQIQKSSVTMEEYHVLSLRVDHMENTIRSIVSKIESVLMNLDNIENTKSKRREAMSNILQTLTSDDDLSDEARRKKLEILVNEEINKMNQESAVSIRPKSGISKGSRIFRESPITRESSIMRGSNIIGRE